MVQMSGFDWDDMRYLLPLWPYSLIAMTGDGFIYIYINVLLGF